MKPNKSPYFTVSKAQRVSLLHFPSLTDRKLHNSLIKLRDFERYVGDSECYMEILFEGGFYVSAATQASTGFAPVDIWMLNRLRFALENCIKEAKRRGWFDRQPTIEAKP